MQLEDTLNSAGHNVKTSGLLETLPEEPKLMVGFTRFLANRYDLLVLPMSLPNQNSLRIAQSIHEGNISLKTFLITVSPTASSEVCKPLFDFFVKDLNPERVIAEMRDTKVERMSWKSLRNSISVLLGQERTLQRPLNDRHSEPISYDIYELGLRMHSPDISPRLYGRRTVNIFNSVTASEVVMGPGKIVHKTNVKSSNSQVAVGSTNVAQAGHNLSGVDKEILAQIAAIVHESSNPSAMAILSALQTELSKKENEPSKIRSYISTIAALLPSVASLANKIPDLVAGSPNIEGTTWT
ncbi:hypothetical protein [Methylobacterium sp. Leaf399]|uniref:hypothetical protein n=1 Tax=Methylobacterium sp. Leaf399 TaxID=1736364 RepID=UPI0012E3D32A|nr:hypothetical protein [Methylobacterium sp. Leaf399]